MAITYGSMFLAADASTVARGAIQRMLLAVVHIHSRTGMALLSIRLE
jgi:hypothetical protein